MNAKIRAVLSRVRRHLILEKKNFKVCEVKEIEQWSWKNMKTEKWLGHLDGEGNFRAKKVEG